jgi:hypothetical protein
VTRLRASLRTTAAVQVVAIVYDLDAENRATLLTRGASLVGRDGEVDFELYPQDWRLRAGHRVGVLLAGSDDFYFAPGTSGATVRVERGSLSLPLLARAREANLGGGPSRAVAERTSFPVDPETVRDRAARLGLPAAARPRLALRVRPRRVRAGRRIRLRITALDGRRRVAGARVRVGRRLVRTGRRGVVRVRIRFGRVGLRSVRASKPGYRRGRAWVRVR